MIFDLSNLNETMTRLLDYPSPFWTYNHTQQHNYKVEEKDDTIIASIEIPGREKSEIDLTYKSEHRRIDVAIKEGPIYHVHLSREIDHKNIDAKLDKGILTITAPVKNTDKQIRIT